MLKDELLPLAASSNNSKWISKANDNDLSKHSNQIIPTALGFEDEFDGFADRAPAAVEFSNVFRRIAEFFASVGDGHAQSHAANQRQIGQIVADITHLLGSKLQITDDFPHGVELVLDALTNDLDAQLGNADFENLRTAERNQSEFVARFVPKPYALPVANVKLLGFDTLVIDDDAAVGQHAVNVGKDQADRLAKLCNRHFVKYEM
jgi:hypothetical protein